MLTRSIVAPAAEPPTFPGNFLQWTCQPLRQQESADSSIRFNGLAEIAKPLPPHYWASAEDSISVVQAPDQFLLTDSPRKYGRPPGRP
jgi:hypothetical protein